MLSRCFSKRIWMSCSFWASGTRVFCFIIWATVALLFSGPAFSVDPCLFVRPFVRCVCIDIIAATLAAATTQSGGRRSDVVWLYGTHPDAVHGAHFGSHRHDEQPVEAERTTRTLAQLRRQRTHEARIAEVCVHAYAHTHTHTHTHIDGAFWKSNPSTKLSPNLIKSCKREFVSRNFSGKEALSVVFWDHLYFRRLEKTETLKTIDDDHVVQSSFYFIFILDNDISYRRLFTLPWRLMWPNTAITNCKYVSAYGSPGVWLHAKANN